MDSKILLMSLLAIAGTGLFLLAQGQQGSTSSLLGTQVEGVAAFTAYRTNFGKSYSSVDEAAYRLSIFNARVAKINAHNADPTQTYTLGINQFTDMTWEELKAFYLSDMPEVSGNSKCEKSAFDLDFGFEAARKDVDWNKKKKVQAVKNQGHCGSCWAFSATGALESIYAIKKNELPSLSEQELVDCSKSYGNGGCNGGLMNLAFDYVLDHHINNDKDYPYVGADRQCKDISGKGKYTLKGCVQVQADVKALIQALAKQPVSVAFHVQDDFFSYKSGIYNPSGCTSRPNHGVLAYGYHLDKDPKKAFFRVKNSWGTTWGDKGHFQIATGTGKGTCNITGTEWNYFPTL